MYLQPRLKEKLLATTNSMIDSIHSLREKVESSSMDRIIKVHKTAWNRIWESGFTITDSYADNTYNGDRFNLTMYHILSHKIDSLVSLLHNSDEGEEMTKNIANAKSCSDGPTVLNIKNLWRQSWSNIELVDLPMVWFKTLKHRGCSPLFEMSAQGLLQAIIYSVGSIRLSTGHVALWIRPQDLHRGLTLRNVMLTPFFVYADLGFYFVMNESTGSHETKLFIQRRRVIPHRPISKDFLTASNKQVNSMLEEKIYIQESVGPIEADFISGKKFEAKSVVIYACSATCNPIQEVEYERESIEILLTNPPSAIMNIAVSDSENLNDVAQALHLDEVRPGGHLRHDLLLLHKHGHMLRGLPMTFWISLGILVFVFHLFLCRLIYSEFLRDDEYVLPVNNIDHGRSRSYSFKQENFSEKMASIYVNSHLANRKARKQRNYHNDLLP